MNSLAISYSDVEFIKGRVTYLHGDKDINSGAFEKKEKAELRILLPRSLGVVSAFAKVYDEYNRYLKTERCSLQSFDFSTDVYTLNLNDFSVGLYFLCFEFNCACGKIFGMKGHGRELIIKRDEDGDLFQFSIVDFEYPEPSSYYGGVIYHIFVDRFNRGGKVKKRDDALLIEDWEGAIPEYPQYPGAHLENNTFFGGTLYGIIEKLDYIKSLGTTMIYLSPIFEAYSNHKYDTGDYMTVDAMFGGEDALVQLISEAKSRGIGIILDGVFNHTGSDSIYFNKNGRYKTLGAYQSKESAYYKWFDFKNFPDKYTCWWGIEILPRINPDIKECGDYIAGECGVIDKYTKLGVEGFRLDVADELSDSFIADIKSRMQKNCTSSILYGEVWEDASNKIAYDKRKHYYLGKELDGVMNYPLRNGIIAFLKEKDKSLLEYAFLEVMFNSPLRIRNAQMNLLGTHDTERIITMLAGESAEGKSNDTLAKLYLTAEQKSRGIKLLKMAYAILATVPGLPTIFYGDEVGLEGYKDPFNRRPYPWKNVNEEIREFYKLIGKIRNSSEVYADGDFEILSFDDEKLIFKRLKGDAAVLTVINNSEKILNITLSNESLSLVSGVFGRGFSLPSMSLDIISTKANASVIIS